MLLSEHDLIAPEFFRELVAPPHYMLDGHVVGVAFADRAQGGAFLRGRRARILVPERRPPLDAIETMAPAADEDGALRDRVLGGVPDCLEQAVALTRGVPRVEAHGMIVRQGGFQRAHCALVLPSPD